MNVEQRVRQFITKNKLISARGLVLIGVSGGADSMALLLILSRLRHELGVQIHALHFNHQFRPDSGNDERFVALWCKRLNIPLTVGRRKGGKIKHLSEDQARQMRFQFFLKTTKALRAQSVALAHTRNDLAETVLMRLMRGSGLYGLRAILPQRDIEGIRMIRPLLCLNRADIESYLKHHQTPFCTDSTNNKMLYERNKVRHQLLPLLSREYNPKITDALSDLALTAAADYEFLSKQVRRQFEKKGTILKGKVKIDLKTLTRQDPAIVRLLLRRMIEVLTHDPAALTFEHIQAMEELILQKNGSRLDLPLKLKAVKTKTHLELLYA